jgi:hypothetical protein
VKAHLTNAADAHRDDPMFGYRFIADDLAAAGDLVSERRVWRLCSQQRLWSLHAKKRGLTRKRDHPCTMIGCSVRSQRRTSTSCG